MHNESNNGSQAGNSRDLKRRLQEILADVAGNRRLLLELSGDMGERIDRLEEAIADLREVTDNTNVIVRKQLGLEP